jgi:Tfp pilus assembly protein PilF
MWTEHCPYYILAITDTVPFCALETFVDTASLEYYMEIPHSVRLDRFNSLLEIGDVVEGHVSRKIPLAIEGTLDRFVDPQKKRHVQDLDVSCIMKITDMAKSHSEQEVVYKDFRRGDVFKAVVSKVDKKNDIIYVSLKDEHLKSSHLHVQLGYLEHKRPLSPKPPPRDKDFRNNLLCDPAFHNPACVKNLVSVLGIECSSRKSFLESNLGPPYAPEEYAEELRIAQRRRYSIEFTASGVAYMKEGKEKQAKKCFDQALDVHSNNVEALVARGALYANQKGFESAISDFTAALKLNSEHKNAKRYLASTHTAYAKDLEKEGKIVTSLKQYQAALTTDPDHPESSIARERLTTLKGILDRQIEEEKRKNREEKILKKALRKIMHKKKSKKDKHKSRKAHRKKHRRHSATGSLKNSSKKKSRSKYSSSSSDSESTSSVESDRFSTSSNEEDRKSQRKRFKSSSHSKY